jgi:hypothetical protein
MARCGSFAAGTSGTLPRSPPACPCPFLPCLPPTLQLPGDHKLLSADTPQDFKQLLRHLTDSPASVPHWRQERPALLVEAAEFRPQQPADAAAAVDAERKAGKDTVLMLVQRGSTPPVYRGIKLMPAK